MPPAAVCPATRRPYYRAGRRAVSAPWAGPPQELPMGRLLTLCKRSVQSFGADQCATLAAAIAYHTVFALFPIALFGGLLLAATASAGVLQGARTSGGTLGPLLHLAAPLFVLLTVVVPLALTFLAFLFLYKVAPHTRLTWGDV